MSFYKARPNFEDRQVVQYSATSITLSGDTNIHPVGNLRIQKDAVPGYVAISLDSNGTVGWGPISGVNWSVSACTSPLYVNNLVSCPLTGGTIQVDAGSFDLNSELRFLISLSASPANNEVLVVDNNGYVQKVPNLMGVGNMWHVPFGYTLTIPDNYQSFIYGDILIEGTVDLQTNAELVILNGNLILSGGSIIGSGSTYLITLGGGGSGTTIVQFTGNTSGTCITDFYVTNIYGCSPLHIQPLSGTGDVYLGEGGFVNFGVGTNVPTAKLHVVADGSIGSTMILKISDNISDRFTIKDDGTIDIVNNSGLYIDSTSTFNYANGAVDGYVLTSNSVGGASWQPLSGGTTIVPFTGNTSASCITDLWVENINGCSTGVTIQNHTVFNNSNTFGPIRPNYVSDLITSGNTSGGTYQINIPSGWVIDNIYVYIKNNDTGLVDSISIDTVGGIWNSAIYRSIGPGFSYNFVSVIGDFGGGYNAPQFFTSSDTLNIYFNHTGTPTPLTDGEYKVLIKYWDGLESGILI